MSEWEYSDVYEQEIARERQYREAQMRFAQNTSDKTKKSSCIHTDTRELLRRKA